MKKNGFLVSVVILAWTTSAAAHEPIFAPGAHVHSKGAHEVSLGYHRARASGTGENEAENEYFLEYEYGVTADLTVSAEVPFEENTVNGNRSSGLGDIQLAAKYRFLRIDSPGKQYSTAVLFKAKLPTGDDDKSPRLGSGSADFVGGLAHGLESRRWYYNTAVRYRLNTEGGGNLEKGDKVFLDLVGGVRPVLSGYRDADTVLFLELNGERSARNSLNGSSVTDSGGWELFLSPGIFWTYRNYALTSGVQIPIAENLNGSQPTSDYRFKLTGKYAF
ncbi:MAG: transporter [Rhodospirillales bacterium]|nr:transporter [Rhodospirillales bacterium]